MEKEDPFLSNITRGSECLTLPDADFFWIIPWSLLIPKKAQKKRNPSDEVEWNHNYWNKKKLLDQRLEKFTWWKPPLNIIWVLKTHQNVQPHSFSLTFLCKREHLLGYNGCLMLSWIEKRQMNAMSSSIWRRFWVNLLKGNTVLQLWICFQNKELPV